MPLVHSKSDDAVSENIRRLIAEGKPRDQAVAISLDIQRRATMNGSKMKKPKGK